MEEGAEEEGDYEEGAWMGCRAQCPEGGEEDWKPFDHEWMTVGVCGGGGEEEVALGGFLVAKRLRDGVVVRWGSRGLGMGGGGRGAVGLADGR